MFNILQEKWIPLIKANGEFEKRSLKDTIVNAHMFQELAEYDSILECSLYRFLFTFVSDMVFTEHGHDEELEDIIEELLEGGTFPPEMLEHYLEKCEAEGVSFDIFDECRPFMQNGDYEYTDKDIVSVAKLSPRAASGTNKLFQNHTTESEFVFSYEESVMNLLAYSPFNTPGGSGWGSGHFGAYPPVFTYVCGESLFETLLFNMIENNGSDRPDHVPYWRMSMKGIKKGTEASTFSTYASMHYPWRFLKLIPAEGSVRQMYYVPGFSIDKNRPDIPKDPYATYLPGKKPDEEYLFCAKESSVAWRNITGVFDLTSAPLVVKNYRILKESLDLGHINVMTYVTIVKDVHGTFTGAWKNKVSLPSSVLDPGNSILDYMKMAIEYAEKKCWKLNKASEKAIGKEDYKSRKTSVEAIFYSSCRNLFFNDYVPQLGESENHLIEAWKNNITRTALNLFDEQIISSLIKMEDLKNAYDARRLLYDTDSEKREGK